MLQPVWEADSQLTVGILALQGDFTPHRKAAEALGYASVLVRYPEELAELDALIMPGGESTTIWKLLDRWGFVEPLAERIEAGMPVWGTCAGAILLARAIEGSDQPTLGHMAMSVIRNAYGRQVDSFEAPVAIKGLDEPVRAVFIRAPVLTQLGPSVEVLARHEGSVVAARQGNLLATTFHPELTDDLRLHRLFLNDR